MGASEVNFKMEMGSGQNYRWDEFLNLRGEFLHVCVCTCMPSCKSEWWLEGVPNRTTVNHFGLG